MTLGKSLNVSLLYFLRAFKTELMIAPIRVVMIVFMHRKAFPSAVAQE